MPSFNRTCPNKCSGKDYNRQHDLTDGIFKRLPSSAQEVIRTSPDQATRCSYCGCVYLYSYEGSQRLGTFEVIEGWKSNKYP